MKPKALRPLTFDEAVEVCIRHMRGDKLADIAVMYCKTDSNIRAILSGRSYKGAQEIAVQMYNEHAVKYGLKPKLSVRHKYDDE